MPSYVCGEELASPFDMDGGDDHVHLLVEYPPKVAVSSLVNSLQGVSSLLLRKERPDTEKHVGAPVSIVCQYIEQQQTPL